MKVYEISFHFLAAQNKCSGELFLPSGRFEVYEGVTFEVVSEAMYARLLGIRRRQIRAGLIDEEDTFYDE